MYSCATCAFKCDSMMGFRRHMNKCVSKEVTEHFEDDNEDFEEDITNDNMIGDYCYSEYDDSGTGSEDEELHEPFNLLEGRELGDMVYLRNQETLYRTSYTLKCLECEDLDAFVSAMPSMENRESKDVLFNKLLKFKRDAQLSRSSGKMFVDLTVGEIVSYREGFIFL